MRKLTTSTLAEALKGMKPGEICEAPDGYTIGSVRVQCAILNREGYTFQTSTRGETVTVTRLK